MNTYIKLKALLYSLALSLAVICLSSCGKTVVSEPGDGLGRDRVQPSETTDSETTMEMESETTADTASDGKMWTLPTENTVFNFPERSDEGLATIDEMYDHEHRKIRRSADDWFFGKTYATMTQERSHTSGIARLTHWRHSKNTARYTAGTRRGRYAI